MRLIQIFISPVAANIAVNACIATGYTPATVTDLSETQTFASKADGLLVNIGNLQQATLASMRCAAEVFETKGKSWVLDPVAVGGTQPRLQAALDLLAFRPGIIRGNPAEIKTLAHALGLSQSSGVGRGPDSFDTVASAQEAAKALAVHADCIVGVSGETDFVTDSRVSHTIKGGHAWMPKVTGLGCAVSALMAAFCSNNNALDAALLAFEQAARAGEIAGQRAQGPGTFQAHWLDGLYEQTL